MSILDDILKSPEEGIHVDEPVGIEEVFAQMFTECADCQQEWNDHLQWCVDHEKKASFHWAIVCCEKHAKLVRAQLTGEEPNDDERTLNDILEELEYVQHRMSRGMDYLNAFRDKSPEERKASMAHFELAEAAMNGFALIHCQLLNEYYRRNAAFIPYGIE